MVEEVLEMEGIGEELIGAETTTKKAVPAGDREEKEF